MKVKNLTSANGDKGADQFEIIDGNKRVFQSYDSVICVVENGVITLDEYYWNHSRTTSKYRNIFLCETTKETKKKIEEGVYKLAKLN